jgi:hypothetical protein
MVLLRERRQTVPIADVARRRFNCGDHSAAIIDSPMALISRPRSSIGAPGIASHKRRIGITHAEGNAVFGNCTPLIFDDLELRFLDGKSEVVPVGWTSGPSKLIKTFAGRASGLVAVEDRSD